MKDLEAAQAFLQSIDTHALGATTSDVRIKELKDKKVFIAAEVLTSKKTVLSLFF